MMINSLSGTTNELTEDDLLETLMT
jgi:hypothetical protein